MSSPKKAWNAKVFCYFSRWDFFRGRHLLKMLCFTEQFEGRFDWQKTHGNKFWCDSAMFLRTEWLLAPPPLSGFLILKGERRGRRRSWHQSWGAQVFFVLPIGGSPLHYPPFNGNRNRQIRFPGSCGGAKRNPSQAPLAPQRPRKALHIVFFCF